MIIKNYEPNKMYIIFQINIKRPLYKYITNTYECEQ